MREVETQNGFAKVLRICPSQTSVKAASVQSRAYCRKNVKTKSY